MKLCKKSFAERRKILERIPYGVYCHGATRNEPCPYWRRSMNGQGVCRLLNVSDYILLWDQVKVCGYNEDWN